MNSKKSKEANLNVFCSKDGSFKLIAKRIVQNFGHEEY